MPKQEAKNIPAQVNRSDINHNGLILSKEELAYAKKYFKKNRKVNKLKRFSNGDDTLGINKIGYSVIRTEKGSLYAIYSVTLGRGGNGKVKLAQNLATKEWHALKVQTYCNPEIDVYSRYHNIEQEIKNVKMSSGYYGKLYRMSNPVNSLFKGY